MGRKIKQNASKSCLIVRDGSSNSSSTVIASVSTDINITSGPLIVSSSKGNDILHVESSSYQSYFIDNNDITQEKEEEKVVQNDTFMKKITTYDSCDILPYANGEVNLFEFGHFGLILNYACIGFLNGLFPSIVYPFFKLYLNMESYQVNAASVVLSLPWSFKTVVGILSDHYPLFGSRRKSYMLIGWFIAFVFLLFMAYTPKELPYFLPGEIQRTSNVSLRIIENPNAPKAGSKYLLDLMAVCFGYVIVDVACDGIMVELAQHERMEIRGTLQSTIYITRYSANLIAAIVATFCLNGKEYGGSFDWTFSYTNLFFCCCFFCVFGCIGTCFFLNEEKENNYFTQNPFNDMWQITKQRAIWQLMLFHFMNSFLSSFNFSSSSGIQQYWAKVDPLSDSIANCISIFLFVLATFTVKTWFLHTSWRAIMVVCSLMTIIGNFTVNFLVIYDICRNKWFYLGAPQLVAIPDRMRVIISGFVTVEIAEHGFEGATYSLLTTVHNVAGPVASSVSNAIDAKFDVSDQDLQKDTDYVRSQVAITVGIAMVMQVLSLGTIFLLPTQKQQAQELKIYGGKNAFAAFCGLFLLAASLVWSVVINLLSIYSSTACLRIAGGKGC